MLLAPACFTLAYIGPGAGLGLVGALVSLLASIGFALVMVVAWPIRAALKKQRAAAGQVPNAPSETPPQP